MPLGAVPIGVPKVSLALKDKIGPRVTSAKVPTRTGKPPVMAGEVAFKVVEVVPFAVAVLVPGPKPPAPKARIEAALVVLASENAATNAKLRVALMSLRKAASSIDEHHFAPRK